MANLEKVEGIGEAYAKKLRDAGVSSTEMLLEAGSTKKGRDDLAAKSEIAPKMILKWVNHVDLFRIKGVGEEYADLLEASGVDTVPELAQRRADNLHKRMSEVNAEKKLVRQLPSEKQVQEWIDQAKELPRKINY
jgi:predicted flap endonuclease-1-like 5' DNA nuclease